MPSAETLFELLFKYRPFVFDKGDLVLLAGRAGWIAAALVVLVALPALRLYPRLAGKSTRPDRRLLLALRVCVLVLIVFCLLRPALVVATAVPQQNFVGVLLDDSRSMSIADRDDQPRGSRARDALTRSGGLLERLGERFRVRLFRFAGELARVDEPAQLRFAGTRTELASALGGAWAELSSLPLSGLVLVTDGADNSGVPLAQTLERLADAGVPVFTVGVGRDEFTRDVEVASVQVPDTVLRGSSVGADVVVRQRGYDGRRVELFVEDEGRLLATHTVTLPRGAEATVVRARFVAEEPGARAVTFRVAPLEGEMVRRNNQSTALVRVRDDAARILYFEGEPRFEVAFLRRALRQDDNLAVVKLVVTAPNKFWREIVEPEERFGGADELFAGFPRTREELYAYDGLILGSVAAGQFTPDQQRMIADFVSQRGGGVLLLGGYQSFARGGWRGTPLEQVLPVLLPEEPPRDADGAPVEYARVHVMPTLSGRSHPAVQLADTPEASLERWRSLPPLTTVNPMSRTRPGAVTLLEGRGDRLAEPQVILAFQRYGAGKAIVFNVVDSWQWQMHHDVPLEDQTHETLWRQLLRWLAGDVKGRVQARLEAATVAPGETVAVRADVFDDTFLAVNNAAVTARVVMPDGSERSVPLAWNVEVDGRYEGSFVTPREGLYEIHIEARRGEVALGADTLYARAGEIGREYFGAERNRSLLERIAAQTGGRYYPLERADELAEEIRFSERGRTVTEVLDLWDMPVVFLALVALLGGEWCWRKIRGLA